jgi:DNA-binding MarR family transcriptional regulator
MTDLDPYVHQPVRLRMLMLLSGVETADFDFILRTLGITKGNLSSHTGKLEQARHVEIKKSFNGKVPHTEYSVTAEGRKALAEYWQALDTIRGLGATDE